MRARIALILTVAVCACVLPAARATAKTAGQVTITSLSNRADLISGGNALVDVAFPEGIGIDLLRVTANGRDVTNAFSLARPGRAVGLVEGLALGRNILEARIARNNGARLIITNHPKGGPVFAGPQVQPWVCATEEHGLGPAIDDQCNAPTKVSYVYQPEDADPGRYESYDPDNPPSDVATTTTDDGREVRYILRVERGTIDRSIYELMVLRDAWNEKLFVAFGGGCGTMHRQLGPDPWFGLMEGSASEGQISQHDVLSKGWMTGATGMNTFNYNCNEVVSAEALMMMKEHIVEAFGPIHRTISVGNSGGSVQQQNIAAAYPGLLDAIVPSQSFPDLWNMAWDAVECYLQYRYFTTISPHLWLDPSQQLAVTGKEGVASCGEFVALFADPFDPQNRGPFQNGAAVRFGCELPPTQTYHPILNPTGARCSVQDYQRSIWGLGGPLNAAPLPYDNTGVQYGLDALRAGRITAEQFVDLNTKIGGLDNEGEHTVQRSAMSDAVAATMYRAGRTTDPRQLAKVPMIDIRRAIDSSRPEELSDMHQPYNSFVTRARLDAVNGGHANQVFWRFVPQDMDLPAVFALDRWLHAVEADTADVPIEQKIIRNRPHDLVDTCWIDGGPVTDYGVCQARYPHGADARLVAGAPLRNDMRKCQLKPLAPSDYPVAFTLDQWARLRSAFPSGVCDWTKPSVGYQPSIPWMTYAGGPGGSPLGAPPRSTNI